MESSGSGSSGGGSVALQPVPVFVPISDAQLALLEQSYAAYRQSLYDGLVLQTRLKGYLDAVVSEAMDRSGALTDERFGRIQLQAGTERCSCGLDGLGASRHVVGHDGHRLLAMVFNHSVVGRSCRANGGFAAGTDRPGPVSSIVIPYDHLDHFAGFVAELPTLAR